MERREPDAEPVLEGLRALHAEVDADAAKLERRHQDRLECKRGCSACCLDGLTALEVEAARIREEFSAVLHEAPGPAGACAFLDAAGACRVYAARPYICRTQGLPLAIFHEDAEGEVVEERSICELNVEGEPLDTLDLDECWVLGPVEQRLVDLQERFAGRVQRVPLRELFVEGREA